MFRRTFLVILLLGMLPTISYADTPKSELYILYFGAKWCGPCKTLHNLFLDPEVAKEVAKFDHALENNVPFPHYTDIDEDERTTKIYDVRAVPTILIVEIDDEEVKVVRRMVGAPNKQKLLEFLSAGKNHIDTSVHETIIIPPVWTLKGVILLLFKLIKIFLG